MADLRAKPEDAKDFRIKLIATDGVFSMDGLVVDLKSICDLAEEYDALVKVDDSYAAGFMGATGRGTPEYCGVVGRVDVIDGGTPIIPVMLYDEHKAVEMAKRMMEKGVCAVAFSYPVVPQGKNQNPDVCSTFPRGYSLRCGLLPPGQGRDGSVRPWAIR